MAKSNQFKLPPETVKELLTAQRQLHDILPEMDTAEQCGIECQEYRRMAKDASDTITALLDNYGPAANR